MSTLDGQVGLAEPTRGRRLPIIELACSRTELQQLVAAALELRYPAEIAGETPVIDRGARRVHELLAPPRLDAAHGRK